MANRIPRPPEQAIETKSVLPEFPPLGSYYVRGREE